MIIADLNFQVSKIYIFTMDGMVERMEWGKFDKVCLLNNLDEK